MSNNILIDGELYDSETGELINEVEQVEVEIIEDSLPDIVCNGGTHIKTNTEQLKRELILHLEKYDIEVKDVTEAPKGCICGPILRGLKRPTDCKLFGKSCTPLHPIGACMVSKEGTCNIAHRYTPMD